MAYDAHSDGSYPMYQNEYEDSSYRGSGRNRSMHALDDEENLAYLDPCSELGDDDDEDGDSEPEYEISAATAAGSMQYIARYLSGSNYPLIQDKLEREEAIHAWLVEYHDHSLSDDHRFYCRDCVVFNVFYLFPYILSTKKIRFALFDEMIQQLVENTLIAIEKFDPSRGHKLTSYLTGYIKDAIATCLAQDSIVRVPVSARKKQIQALKRERIAAGRMTPEQADTLQNPDSIDLEDTDDSTRMNNQDFFKVQAHSVVSTDYLNKVTKSATYNIEEVPTPESILEDAEFLEVLEYAVSSDDILTEREKVVITYRYGIFGAPKSTLKEVSDMFQAQKWNGTVEWIFQLEKRALRNIRTFMETCGITSDTLFSHA